MTSTDSTLTALVNLVAVFAGLRIGPRDQSGFYQTVQHRMESLRIPALEDYLTLLRAGNAPEPSSVLTQRGQQEWRALLAQLTIGESYFFRDERQFNLLRQTLIPGMLKQRQAMGSQRHLRVWSAGCSTGEEVYSLAILLREIKLDWEGWTLDVVGTDVNQDFLSKAQRGIYSPWSFRQTAPSLRQQYFLPERHETWQIRPEIQRITQFHEFNLAHDPVDRLVGMGRFDLIVCRNVFIYFTPDAIAMTLAKFYQALNPGGYLITGHAELQGIPLGGLRVHSFPESIVYQRPLHTEANTQPKQALREPQPIRPRTAVVPAVLPIGPTASTKRTLAQSVTTPVPQITPDPFAAALQQAHQFANKGDYADARKACEGAIAVRPFAVEPCYLLANIAEETGDLEGAKVFLKRVIYLDPQAIPAYLELADLYSKTQDSDRADKTRRNALSVLSQFPPEQSLSACSGATAEEICDRVRQMLGVP
ncbi:MAG TPA: CheR family methyltransferase [Leptolyngbyaceae cyanobacterium]